MIWEGHTFNIDIKYIITAIFDNYRNFVKIFIQLKIAQIIEECSKSLKEIYHLFKKKVWKFQYVITNYIWLIYMAKKVSIHKT